MTDFLKTLILVNGTIAVTFGIFIELCHLFFTAKFLPMAGRSRNDGAVRFPLSQDDPGNCQEIRLMATAFDKAMGRVIRQLRKERGLTQTQLGSALEVTFQQAQKYENGTNGLAAHYLPRIASLLGTTVADLYARAGHVDAFIEPNPAENDSFLAARYVGKIADPKIRSVIIDVARKVAYQGEVA
jgi:transcriptional regulator with XRE-family HTH domain